MSEPDRESRMLSAPGVNHSLQIASGVSHSLKIWWEKKRGGGGYSGIKGSCILNPAHPAEGNTLH